MVVSEDQPTVDAQRLWLDAWTDPVSGLNAYSMCCAVGNIYGDGEWRMIVADSSKKLKIWKGTKMQTEHPLVNSAAAIRTFYQQNYQIPSLAVATGSIVYIYRNMRPFYKYTLPMERVDPDEQVIWLQMENKEISAQEGHQSLCQLQGQGRKLTPRTFEFLSLQDPASQTSFAQYYIGLPLVQHTIITCISVIYKAIEEQSQPQCLVLGTEGCQVLVMNSDGTDTATKIAVPAAPVFIECIGALDVQYTIVAACRDGKVYRISGGKLSSSVIELEAQAVGLVCSKQLTTVACMNDTVHAYNQKSQIDYSLYMPSAIHCMCAITLGSRMHSKAIALALANKELRVYNGRQLINICPLPGTITSMVFGKYGREDQSLILLTQNGTLMIKILSRTAKLDSNVARGPPKEQDIPFDLPQINSTYYEMTKRDKENAIDIHRAFQKDLCSLRLQTTKAYAKVLTDGKGSRAQTHSQQLKLDADVQGLGPEFKLSLMMRNIGQQAIVDVPVVVNFDRDQYTVQPNMINIPILIPSIQYNFKMSVTNIQPENNDPGQLQVLVVNNTSSEPILAATVQLPQSETIIPDE